MSEWGTRVRKEAREYRLEAIGEVQLTDLAGQLRSIEKGLATLRLDISSEFGDSTSGASVSRGRKWKASTTSVGQQSFNAPAIFVTTQTEGYTMMDLVESGALTLKWGMTKLRKFFADRDMELVTVGHEVEAGDPDGPHMGLWYKPGSTSYKPTDEG